MPTLILTRKELDPGTFLGLSTLAIVSVIIAVSVGVMSSHRNHLAFQSGAANLVAGESHLPMVASKTVLPNVPGPELMQFPLAGNGLLQFTSGGHVLGFREKEVFIAAGDHALKVEFVGARASLPHVQGKPEMMVSNERGGRPLGKVIYPDVWDGVTVVYEGSPGAVAKSTYYIAPRTQQTGHTGSPVDQIRLRYNVPVRLDDKGNLVMSFETGEIRESAPVAWQEVGGQRVPVEVAYCLLGEKEVGFRVGKHDPAVPLIIDPKLVWNTFMGSGGDDSGNDIALDLSGNIYVAGHSSAGWGTGASPYQGNKDGFVAKLNSAGVRQWHTFMGAATGDDVCYGISLDSNGNIYLAGFSTVGWGPGAPGFTAGGQEAFAAKLNGSGVFQWNTFMGSAADDQGYKVAVDGLGNNVYVCGFSDADWAAPATVDDYVPGNGREGFVAQLDNLGALQRNTFMGATGDDYANRITVDDSGKVYVAGLSTAAWGAPKTVNSHAGGAGYDAFVAKLTDTLGLTWNTFMGAAGTTDEAYGVAVDSAGNVYVAGQSAAGWGGAPSLVNPYAGGSSDGFAVKLDAAGARLWHTFMGSSGADSARTIAVDSAGQSYVFGISDGNWGQPIVGHAGGSGWDAFLLKLNGNGTRRWNTFMGSTVNEDASGIAVDNSGFVYVGGISAATWGAPVNFHAGGAYDAFVAKHTTSDIKAKQFYFSPVHNLKE